MNPLLALLAAFLITFFLGFVIHVIQEWPEYLQYWHDLSHAKKELKERFGNKKFLENPSQEDKDFILDVAYRYRLMIGRRLTGGFAIVNGKIETHKSLVIRGRF